MVTSISARVLGQRIRQLRTRRGLTQQDLAAADYSKSYISAIEQGKTRPSLEALQRLASRLEVPAGLLLDPDAQGFAPYDPEATPRRVRRRRGARGGYGPGDPAQLEFQLALAEAMIYTGQAAQALQTVLGLIPDEEPREATRPIDSAQVQRMHYLVALAATRSGDPPAAIEHAQTGLGIALRLGDLSGAERLRNLLGLAHQQNDAPLQALEHHRTALEAVQSSRVRDPNLKLQILYNLAADYWALHDNERAYSTYKEALDLLNEINTMEQQGRILMDLSKSASELHDYGPARSFVTKAAGIYEGLENIQLVARIENRYGDMLVEMGDLKGAETYLGRSLELAETLNSEADKALALTNLARFMLKQGNLDEAENHAKRAVEVSRSGAGFATRERSARGKGAAHSKMRSESARVLSKALAVSGEVATQRGDTAGADQFFSEAIKILESNEAPGSSSDVYQRYAQVLSVRGDHEQAAKYFERAYRAVTNRTR